MMSVSTILRVKRRLEDNPQDAFVLMCKRAKTAENENEISPSVFVFQGTLQDGEKPEIHLEKVLPKFKTSKTNIEDVIKKIREDHKHLANQSRYEIVNCSRGIKEIEPEAKKKYTFVDLAKKQEETEAEVKYAYDLYISQKQDFDVSMLDDIVRIENYESDLIFGNHRNNGQRCSSSEGEESDDSNDENNWRNEYPDTDNSSINEDDMVQAMKNVDLGEDLSSESDLDIYDDDPKGDPEDVERYGPAYAKYKARILSEDKVSPKNLSESNVGTTSSVDAGGITVNTSEIMSRISNSRNYVHCIDDSYKDDSDDGFYYGQDEDTEHFKDQYTHDESGLESD